MVGVKRKSQITESEYTNIHAWAMATLGTPLLCSSCGFSSDNRRQFNWANLSGKYTKDPTDWLRLCVGCHKLMDNDNKCRRGHELTPKNSYIRQSNGWRQCRECRSAVRRKYYTEIGK